MGGRPARLLHHRQSAPGVDSYELGKKMCKTWADSINYDMEHTLYDLKELREFMRGLADGGGTRSGHRFPAVFVTCPVLGLNENYMLANSWVLGQILDAGVSGIQLCHTRDPKAVEVAAHMACRYPFAYPGVPKLKREGLRGASANYAAGIWGMNNAQYVRIADLWPLNPAGEIIFGLKIEDPYGDAIAAQILDVPGIAFAEWGPTDNNYWLNGFDGLSLDGKRFDDAKFPKAGRGAQADPRSLQEEEYSLSQLWDCRARNLQLRHRPAQGWRDVPGRHGTDGDHGPRIYQAENAGLTRNSPGQTRALDCAAPANSAACGAGWQGPQHPAL